jgi:uncharacterized low-complexity protein
LTFRHVSVLVTSAVAAVAMDILATQAADADIGITINGSAVDVAPAPIIQNGRVFVPLRGVFEQLGASVVYSNGAIDATGNGRDIALQIGSTQATVNGQQEVIDVAPFIVGASTYVPLRFISEALGDSVNWDDSNSIVAIDTAGGSGSYFAPGTGSYVDTPPPPIPVYDQPYVPQPNYIWQPGYWAWGPYGYYWVPGTWVAPPQTGYLWTPGYWGFNNGGYAWNPGYWAAAVGFYGGINYGAGYFGNGYSGGRWSGNQFSYNSYVTRVNVTSVRNVYVDRTVYVDNTTTRPSYNGGPSGVRAAATPQQAAVARERHVGMTPEQRQHVVAAAADRRLLATVNHAKPPVLAVARPLTPAAHPAGFVPVTPSDRVKAPAKVAPVRVAPVRVAPAAAAPPAHAPAMRVAPTLHPAAVEEKKLPQAPVVHATPAPARIAPTPHAPPADRVAPPVHAPVPATVRVAPTPHAPAVHAPPPHAPAIHAAPASGEPKADEPKREAPKADEPKAGEPKAGEPKAGEPKAGEPKADEPKADEPKPDKTPG